MINLIWLLMILIEFVFEPSTVIRRVIRKAAFDGAATEVTVCLD